MKLTVQEASLRQTLAAIKHFEQEAFDCAITLAAAGEGILPDTEAPNLFDSLRNYKNLELNAVVNWLKHGTGFASAEIDEYEAAFMIARAITKFVAVYHKSHPTFESFLRTAYEAGYLPVKIHRE